MLISDIVVHLAAQTADVVHLHDTRKLAPAVELFCNVACRRKLLRREPQRFLIVENGGDIYAEANADMDIAVFAGQSPLSEKIGLHIPAADFPLGICTSSGTVGPSLSLGRADAVMIVCKDVMLADSYATAMANRIQSVNDLQPVIDRITNTPDILGAIAVKDDRMAICGQYELRLFK